MTTPDEDVTADDLDGARDVPLTTDPDQQDEALADPNTGEEGSG